MIRFSGALVVVAVGVLIGGVATSTLPLVYVAIVLSALALIALAIGVALKRDELFGVTGQPVEDVMGAAAGQSAPGVQQGGYPAPPSHVRGTGAPAPGLATPVAPPPRGMPAPGPVGAPVPAPATSRSSGVAETRADLTAYRADVPGKAEKEPGRGVAETRLDLSPVLADETAAPVIKPPTAAEETRLDLPAARSQEAARPEKTVRPEKAAPDVPPPAPEERRSAADETRFDLPAAGPQGSGTDTPPAAADETRFDLPAAGPQGSGTDTPPAAADETRFDLPAQPPAPAPKPAGSVSEAKAVAGDTQVAIIPGVPRYHAPNCILIRFMEEEELEKMTLDEAKAAGCTPCTACQTDPSSDTTTD